MGEYQMTTVGTLKEIWRYPVKSMRGETLRRCRITSKGLVGDRGWAVRDDKAGEIRGGRHLPGLLGFSARYDTEPETEPWPPARITGPTGEEFASDDTRASEFISEHLHRPASIWPIQPAENLDHYRRLPLTEHDLVEQFGREPDEPLPDMQIFPQELMQFVAFPGTYFDVLPIHLLTTASLSYMREVTPGADWNVQRFRPNMVVDTADAHGLLEADWPGQRIQVGEVELSCYSVAPRCSITMQGQGNAVAKDPGVLRSIVKHADQNLGVYCKVEKGGTIHVGDKIVVTALSSAS